MPSIFSHAIAALALGSAVRPVPTPTRYWVLGALLAALPDMDVVAFAIGIPQDALLGHRGITHSLVFAAVVGGVAAWIAFPQAAGAARRRLWAFFFLAMASHGVLDAMTDGGHGIAFFAPFSEARYFFPWRPILVSPIGVRPFFSRLGAAVLGNELVWIWLPAAVLVAAAMLTRIRQASVDRD